MRVIGAADVERAGPVLRATRQDLVTPLARERARELGVRIELEGEPAAARSPAPVRPPAGRPAPAPPPTARAPSGALYRRGAPTVLDRPGQAALGAPPRPGRVTVAGAGRVGGVTAMALARAGAFAEVILTDVVPGLAEGVALDLQHSAGVDGFETRVHGGTDLSRGSGSDFVVITAGRPRQPGMSRTDLTAANAAVVEEVAAQVARHSPGAVVLVVTNPLDEMTDLAWRVTGFPPERVLGMAGVLDAARFVALASLAGAGPPEAIHALALGSHGEEMVIPLSQATAGGRPIAQVLGAAVLEELVRRTRDSGAEVVRLLQSGSASFAPASAIARMVLAMQADSGEMLPACVRAGGGYGIRDVHVGLPARLGRGGVREIVELPLAPEELEALRTAAERIARRVRAMA